MTAMWRLLPPENVQNRTMVVHGRTYVGEPGTSYDVPEADANLLCLGGWTFLAPSGATEERPKGSLGPYPATRGARFFDLSLNALVIHDGQTWRDAAGTAV
jgi:hypothetical protein